MRGSRRRIFRVASEQFKRRMGFVLLLCYVVLSPIGHVYSHQRFEELPLVAPTGIIVRRRWYNQSNGWHILNGVTLSKSKLPNSSIGM